MARLQVHRLYKGKQRANAPSAPASGALAADGIVGFPRCHPSAEPAAEVFSGSERHMGRAYYVSSMEKQQTKSARTRNDTTTSDKWPIARRVKRPGVSWDLQTNAENNVGSNWSVPESESPDDPSKQQGNEPSQCARNAGPHGKKPR